MLFKTNGSPIPNFKVSVFQPRYTVHTEVITALNNTVVIHEQAPKEARIMLQMCQLLKRFTTAMTL